MKNKIYYFIVEKHNKHNNYLASSILIKKKLFLYFKELINE
jgi:hypothetical protein